ncbi:MAG TPA: hypothetical protein VIK75_02160 [Calditerricola sp.]
MESKVREEMEQYVRERFLELYPKTKKIMETISQIAGESGLGYSRTYQIYRRQKDEIFRQVERFSRSELNATRPNREEILAYMTRLIDEEGWERDQAIREAARKFQRSYQFCYQILLKARPDLKKARRRGGQSVYDLLERQPRLDHVVRQTVTRQLVSFLHTLAHLKRSVQAEHERFSRQVQELLLQLGSVQKQVEKWIAELEERPVVAESGAVREEATVGVAESATGRE